MFLLEIFYLKKSFFLILKNEDFVMLKLSLSFKIKKFLNRFFLLQEKFYINKIFFESGFFFF